MTGERGAGPADGRVTLVGAGLVGSLLATGLARRGIDVEVLERRPDMRAERIRAGRSINLALSTRGIHALRRLGLEHEVLKQAIPMRGRLIHAANGELAFQPYGKDDSEHINSVSRGALNQVLMTAAERTGRVRIEFNARVVGMDLESGDLSLHHERENRFSTRATRVVVGTDGSASAVRDAIAQQAGARCEQSLLDYGYKELDIPAGPGGSFRLEKNALHIWPRGSYMLIALPNFDGSFTCTLFLPYEGPISFASLRTRTQVREFFQRQFADAAALVPDLEDQFETNPTGQMVTVKAWPWSHAGRALLMGDAAHAIVPFFGQGMNCGFEDCTVLESLLERGMPWDQIFREFETLRKPDTDAIADLAVENFTEMRDKVGQPRFLLEKEVEKRLAREFPGEYVPRYSMVTFSRVPYRRALEAGLIQNELLTELCRGIESAEQVDLALAGRRIRERLSGLMRMTAATTNDEGN